MQIFSIFANYITKFFECRFIWYYFTGTNLFCFCMFNNIETSTFDQSIHNFICLSVMQIYLLADSPYTVLMRTNNLVSFLDDATLLLYRMLPQSRKRERWRINFVLFWLFATLYIIVKKEGNCQRSHFLDYGDVRYLSVPLSPASENREFMTQTKGTKLFVRIKTSYEQGKHILLPTVFRTLIFKCKFFQCIEHKPYRRLSTEIFSSTEFQIVPLWLDFWE